MVTVFERQYWIKTIMALIIFLSLSLCCLKQSQFQTNKENNKVEKKHTIFSN